ncbi:cupin domain-containing protein [Thalassobaculum sp.]|uniref:JmjC domain-containing protein n=1 Tax=Thalassobaculum sp. TaxID=2022740 RepID=UPI0032EE845B
MDVSFDRLFKAIDRQTFVRDYLDQRVYHEAGSVQDVGRLFSWDKLNDLLQRPKLWDGKSIEMALAGRVLDPREYCRPGLGRTGEPILRPDRQKVMALLQKGATFVLDYLDGIDPDIAAVTRCFERLFGTNTSCNMYCSWQQVPGYASHFDTMDVFAIQITGEKTWNIYDGRFREATFTAGIRPADFTVEQHNRMRGKVAQRITMRPGDILYLPRGVYHDALATDSASLHLSFGVSPQVGFTVVGMLASEAPKHEFLRKRLPHFEDREELAGYLAAVGDHLKTMLSDPGFVDYLSGYLRDRTFEKVTDYRLPDRAADQYFYVSRHRPEVLEAGGQLKLRTSTGSEVPLQRGDRDMVNWILEREVFWLSELNVAHGNRGPAGERVLNALVESRVVFPVQA